VPGVRGGSYEVDCIVAALRRNATAEAVLYISGSLLRHFEAKLTFDAMAVASNGVPFNSIVSRFKLT